MDLYREYSQNHFLDITPVLLEKLIKVVIPMHKDNQMDSDPVLACYPSFVLSMH